MTLSHTVTPAEDGMTLQALLRGPLSFSDRQAREIKRAGGVTVDGALLYANQPVRAGQRVLLKLPPFASAEKEAAFNATACPAPLRVLYEDEALLAAYKPPGLQCHPSPSASAQGDTLQGRVRAYLGANAHPVHRLDVGTSGIVLFARLPYAQAHLQRQMAEGAFRKAYLAWAYGVPRAESGVIDAPIARVSPERPQRAVCAGGQRAVSRYAVLRTATDVTGAPVSLLRLSPLTGRTHQLRVHMAHAGCPILGDPLYGSEGSFALSRLLGLERQQLCAVSLRFLHPVTLKPVCLFCPPEFEFSPN